MTRELSTAPTTDPAAVEEFPLSPAQLGMWYAQQLDPAVPLYEAQYIDMRGPLDVDLLVAVSKQVSREFESGLLRLVDTGDGPHQVVDRRIELTMAVLDFSDATDPEDEAIRWMRADVAAPIDLLGDRLVMTALLRIAPDRVPSFDTWFKATKATKLNDRSIVISAPTTFAVEWLDNFSPSDRRITSCATSLVKIKGGGSVMAGAFLFRNADIDDVGVVPFTLRRYERVAGFNATGNAAPRAVELGATQANAVAEDAAQSAAERE